MSLDKTRIQKYLMDVRERHHKIEEILQGKSDNEIISNEILCLALRYLVVEIAEAMANILQHILAKEFGIAVKGYVDTIKKAFEKEIISEMVFKNLKPFFDFRNSLIHRYWIIDDAIFINNLTEGKGDFLVFCNEIEKKVL